MVILPPTSCQDTTRWLVGRHGLVLAMARNRRGRCLSDVVVGAGNEHLDDLALPDPTESLLGPAEGHHV